VPRDTAIEDFARFPLVAVLCESLDRHDGPLGCDDYVSNGDFPRVLGKHVPTSGAAPALKEACLQELVKYLFQIALGNLLTSGNVLDLSGLTASVIGHIE